MGDAKFKTGGGKTGGLPAPDGLPGIVDRAAWESADYRGRAIMLVDVMIQHCGPGEWTDGMETLRRALESLDPAQVHTVREAFQAARLELGESVLRTAFAAQRAAPDGRTYR